MTIDTIAESFESIQADSKSKATVKNYEKRNKRFLTWLRSNESSCWDDGSADVLLERISTVILLRYLAAESYSVDGKKKSYSTPEGCHGAILALFS